MNHYVYLLTSKDLTKYYIGVRSCECSPNSDNYWGSSRHLGTKSTRQDRFYKTVLGVFASREEAVAEEIRLHDKYDVAKNDKFINKAKQTSTGWDTTGVSFIKSEKTKKIMSKAQEGNKKFLGRKHSEETKSKMSESAKKRTREGVVVKVIKLDKNTGKELKVYDSMTLAAKDISGNVTNITAVCRGKWKTYKGFKWKYHDNRRIA